MMKTNKHTKIIELCGLPHTGKTTTVSAIMDLTKIWGVSSHLIIERASLCPIRDKLNPLFNLWTVTSLLSEYIEAVDRGVDIVIADRGLLDALIWVNLFSKDGAFDQERESMDLLSSIPVLKKNLLVSYFFFADINVVLNRREDLLSEKLEGRIVNQRTLNGYMLSFEQVKQNFETPIVKVDTTNLSLKQTIQMVTRDLKVRLQIGS